MFKIFLFNANKNDLYKLNTFKKYFQIIYLQKTNLLECI